MKTLLFSLLFALPLCAQAPLPTGPSSPNYAGQSCCVAWDKDGHCVKHELCSIPKAQASELIEAYHNILAQASGSPTPPPTKPKASDCPGGMWQWLIVGGTPGAILYDWVCVPNHKAVEAYVREVYGIGIVRDAVCTRRENVTPDFCTPYRHFYFPPVPKEQSLFNLALRLLDSYKHSALGIFNHVSRDEQDPGLAELNALRNLDEEQLRVLEDGHTLWSLKEIQQLASLPAFSDCGANGWHWEHTPNGDVKVCNNAIASGASCPPGYPVPCAPLPKPFAFVPPTEGCGGKSGPPCPCLPGLPCKPEER